MSDAKNASSGSSIKSLKDQTQTASLKWLRRLTQLAGLAVIGQWSFYGIFRCPFIVPYVSCQNCPVITCHGRLLTMFWAFWPMLLLSVVLFGRAFCAWICPGGLLNQLLGRLASLSLRTRNTLNRMLSYFKYLGLATALYIWLFLGQPRDAVPIRVGDFFSSLVLTFEHANAIWLIRTGVVIGFLLAGLVIAAAWCRFACPIGGLLEFFKPFSLLKIYKTDACNDCNKCLKVCEMETRPAESNCTNCGDCLSVCPEKAVNIGRFRS